jgi:hypothetical protein
MSGRRALATGAWPPSQHAARLGVAGRALGDFFADRGGDLCGGGQAAQISRVQS